MGRAVGDKRRRAAYTGPLVAAVCLHGALLLALIAWKPPPVGKPKNATEIFLMADGGFRGALPAIAPGTPADAGKANAPAATPPPPPPSMMTPAPASDHLSVPIPARPSARPAAPLSLTGLLSSPDLQAAPVPIAAPAPSAEATVPAGSAKECQIVETLKASLNASRPVHEALEMLPPQSRSVANAILLWNGRWLQLDMAQTPSPLGAIEDVVRQAVEASPAACQAEVLHGPRLILVGGSRDTIVLAFGSGDWRWSDMLAPAVASDLK